MAEDFQKVSARYRSWFIRIHNVEFKILQGENYNINRYRNKKSKGILLISFGFFRSNNLVCLTLYQDEYSGLVRESQHAAVESHILPALFIAHPVDDVHWMFVNFLGVVGKGYGDLFILR